jgi:hypothetical protein
LALAVDPQPAAHPTFALTSGSVALGAADRTGALHLSAAVRRLKADDCNALPTTVMSLPARLDLAGQWPWPNAATGPVESPLIGFFSLQRLPIETRCMFQGGQPLKLIPLQR